MTATSFLAILLASAASSLTAEERLAQLPTDVMELSASAHHRYISILVCSADACGYERYVQNIEFAEVTCTKRITEIGTEFASAYPVWKDQPDTLYLTVIAVDHAKSFTAKLVTKSGCDYEFHIEPLSKKNAAESAAPGAG